MNAKPTLRFVMSLAATLVATSLASPSARAEDEEPSPYVQRTLVVVAASRNYDALREEARRLALEAGFQFSDRGLVYDEENGLRWPEEEYEIWAGSYYPRRWDDECGGRARKGCVTVERSEGYPGMKPGYYVIVAGVLDEETAKARLAVVRKLAPDAYLVPTTVYVGCMH